MAQVDDFYINGEITANSLVGQNLSAEMLKSDASGKIQTATDGTDYLSPTTGLVTGSALLLDQTTPQTVINGVPLFNLGIKTPLIYPSADSTTAVKILKADGTTAVMTFDTTNAKVGIGLTPGADCSRLSISGTPPTNEAVCRFYNAGMATTTATVDFDSNNNGGMVYRFYRDGTYAGGVGTAGAGIFFNTASNTHYYYVGAEATPSATFIGKWTAAGLMIGVPLGDSGGGSLQIHASASTPYPYFHITDATTTSTAASGVKIGLDSSHHCIFNHQNAYDIIFSTSNTERMRINSGGGVSMAGQTLDLNRILLKSGTVTLMDFNDGSGANPYIELTKAAANRWSYIAFKNSGTSKNWFVGSSDSDDFGSDTFYIGSAKNAPKFVIDTSFNVGIGTATPAQKLDVNGVSLFQDKIAFTQTDLNEYIDSLADGYMDYGATTSHRFNISGSTKSAITSTRAYFDTYCWFGGTDTGIGYDSNWKNTFAGVSSSYGYIARFRSVGSNDNANFSVSTANNSNGMLIGCAVDSGQRYAYLDSQTGSSDGMVRMLQNGNLTTGVALGFYGNHKTDDSSGCKTQIHGDATPIYDEYTCGDPTDNSSYVDNTGGSYSYSAKEYYVYQYKDYTIGEETVRVWSATPMYFYGDGNSYEYWQAQLAWTFGGEYDGAVVYNATDGYYIDVGAGTSQTDDGSYSGWTSGSPDIQNTSPYQVQSGTEYASSAHFKGAIKLAPQATPSSPENNTMWIGDDNQLHLYLNDTEYTADLTAV